MSSGSGASPVPAGRDPNQDDGDSRAEKGDNHGENQSVPRRPGSASGNQATTNRQQSPRHEVCFKLEKSDQVVDKSDPVSGTYTHKNEDEGDATSHDRNSCNRTSGTPTGPVTRAMTSPEGKQTSPLRTQGKKDSCRDFYCIDYSGQFKVTLVNKDTTKVLKMEIEEEQFVKFCHLFLCDLQLCVVKEALLSYLKLDVLKGGYPPSICTQPGASEPVDTSVKRILTNMCFQLKSFNILSTSWDIEKVKTTLSSLESYQEGNVIGYEVSDDSLNYWLVGEQGAMKFAMEVLDQSLCPKRKSVQQSPRNQQTAETDVGDSDMYAERAAIALQEKAGQTDRRQQHKTVSSGHKKRQGTEQETKRTCFNLQDTRQELFGNVAPLTETHKGHQGQLVQRAGQDGIILPQGSTSGTLKELSSAVTSRHLPLMDKVTEDFFKTKPGQDDIDRVVENTGCLVTLVEQEVAVFQGTMGAVASTRQSLVSATERSDRPNLAGRQWRSEDGRIVALYCGAGWKSTSDVLVELAHNKGSQAVRFQRYQGKATVTLNLPEWTDGRNREKNTIQQNFQDILRVVRDNGYTSLAVLLDDCERCGWKGRMACKWLVKNTLFVFKNSSLGTCSCAYFVRDQAMFLTLRDVINDSFTSDVTSKSLTITDEKDEIALDWEHIDQSDNREKIVLCRGELAKMASDVIVNTTDTPLRLNVGAVSASILKGAGPAIQQECDQYHATGVNYGEVVITHGYKLQCKHVFHGALPRFSSDHQLKHMISFVRRCLTEADKRKYSTISFPALGTGNLGYPRDLVAKTMFDTVNTFFNEWKDSSIERVNFVVYPKDTPTVKVFEDQEKKRRQKVQEDTEPVLSVTKSQDDRNPSPATQSTFLQTSEYEERRVVLKSKSPSPVETSYVNVWLKKTGFENFTIVWPFLQDREALIILQSSNDAGKLLKKPSDQYTVERFPPQIVQILQAPLKSDIVETIKEWINPEEIYNASGAEWFEENGTCFLKGSLPEIQCATLYISKIKSEDKYCSHSNLWHPHAMHMEGMERQGHHGQLSPKGQKQIVLQPNTDNNSPGGDGANFQDQASFSEPSLKRFLQVKKRPPPGSEIHHTKQGVQVFVYQEDLLNLDVDAIIHGTNCSLDNSGDMGRKIARAAGPDLERACANTFLKRGKLNIGECCITTAGNLHYQFIIHAVIPVWSVYRLHNQQNKQLCQDDLCRSILNSLLEADKAGVRSVALPAVGNGIVPPEMCVAAYKEAVNGFCVRHQPRTLTEIHFVDQDRDTLTKVSGVFQTSEQQVTYPVSPAVQRVSRAVVYPFWLAKSDTRGTLQLNERLILCVMKQCFVDTQAAALVSVEDEQFQSRRYVARAIENEAGGKYRKEKEKIKKGKKRPKISDVFHTHAGDMQNVSHVLHVIAPVSDSKTSQDMALWKGPTDAIRACYYQVFKKVDELKLDSVALPSVATGSFKEGQVEELWQVCVEEVVKYGKHPMPKSRLNRIILADPSAKTTAFLIGLLDSMLPSSAMSDSTA